MKFIRAIGVIMVFALCVAVSGCGKRDERHYELALRYKESGDYDKAIGELQAAINVNPRFEKAYNQLGVLYGKIALYDKAAEQFSAAAEINPAFAAAYYNLGVLYQSHLNRPADAVIAYRRYLALAPEDQKSETVRRMVQSLLHDPEVQKALAESAEALELTAKNLEGKGNYRQAVEAYEKELAKNPRAASKANLQLARIYEKHLNNPAEALKHYQAYLDMNINAPDAAAVMADIARLREKTAPAATPPVAAAESLKQAEKLLKQGDASGAINLLLKARDASPEDFHIHDLLAEAYFKSGDLRGAEIEYEWLKGQQRDFAYSDELLSIYRSLGEEMLKRGRYSEAEERFSKALNLSPQDGALHWGLAKSLAGEGKFPKALEEASVARKLLPEEVSNASLADLYVGRARFLINEGQYEGAAESLDEAGQINPGLDLTGEEAGLWEAQARAAQRNGDLVSAERAYTRAIRIDPKRASLHKELAAVYEKLGHYDKAVGELEKSASAGGGNTAAYKDIARIYETYMGDKAKAAAYYRKYLAANPKSADAKAIEKKLKTSEREKEQIVRYEQEVKKKPPSVPNYYNLAVLLQRQDRYKEAIAAYRKALSLEPTNPQAHFNLAYSYDKLKMYDDAIGEYRKAILYKPDYLKAYSNLGAIYKDRRWYGKAIAMFQRALEIDPNYAHAQLGLGSIYADGLRDRRKAEYHYRRYLKLQPNGTYAPQVRAWLAGRR